ncbi:Hermansky-Pudlak syndrome 3 protein isoform X2 [Agrilus planipennis]|uniref:Hermansky-Pudlak syndrome 3 protein isoform X2 n=1 Tax=Agrilus planipennis TaxID=224129 RepID=A0A7F5RE62_AGRPL|nr:Hermansky-Pudlak syndrome 3 protein isoform X2 [Agrilus planipennis]
MVHVISVHNFASQHIQTVEQPTASSVAPPHRLLLALSSHCVEVRDLKSDGDLLFTFPTVDHVRQIQHCINGNFIVTLESKTSRQYKESNSVRVYVNWDSVAALQQSKMTSSGVSLGSSECGMVQPMRARIAGRVTPTTNQSELGSLEMIEIPLRQNPTLVDCCQVSGNILILSANTLTVQLFHIKTHDISKLKFIDFEECPIQIELNFIPNEIAICENYIAYISRQSVHMFKIVSNDSTDNEDQNDALACGFGLNCLDSSVTVDYKKLLEKESSTKSRDRITINLPSILKSNSLIHKNNPFTYTDRDMGVNILSTSPMIDKRIPNCHAVNLVQLKLRPLLIENAQNQIVEEFKCIVLKPLYVENVDKTSDKTHQSYFRSNYRQHLKGVAFMVTTQQEGYLYHFNDDDSSLDKDNCICVYPFTAPVYSIVMEDYLLHALTETGLESYTLRTGHQLCRSLEVVDNINVACPSVDDCICMVGLRPFLGIEKMLLSENFLVLLANADNSPTHSVGSNSSGSTISAWTLYTLELPSAKTIFDDISIVANSHQFASPQTYCHVMSEAHMILRNSLLLIRWNFSSSKSVCLAEPSKKLWEELGETYRTSCALLGDHYILSPKYVLCIPYYKMAGLKPFEVLKRVKKLQEQSNIQITKGLIHYFKTTLLNLKSSSDVDYLIKSGIKHNIIDEILDLFEKHSFDDIPHLVLKSGALREYSTSKFINILTSRDKGKIQGSKEKSLALALLYIQQCNIQEADVVLSDMNREELYTILEENWELLFDMGNNGNRNKGKISLSELATLMMSSNPEVLADVLVSLILDRRNVTLNRILKLFLEYLPSRTGEEAQCAGKVLQMVLEQYLKAYFASYETKELPKIVYDRSTQEAITILVRSYLSQLQILHLRTTKNQETASMQGDPNENDETEEIATEKDSFKYNNVNITHFEDRPRPKPPENYLFSQLRHEYLDKMSPFLTKTEDEEVNEEAKKVLKKLQTSTRIS